MIDAAGLVRVLDLGLAKVIEANGHMGQSAGRSLTRTGLYMGTVDFLAPEQADDAKRADHRADIYSLGVRADFDHVEVRAIVPDGPTIPATATP